MLAEVPPRCRVHGKKAFDAVKRGYEVLDPLAATARPSTLAAFSRDHWDLRTSLSSLVLSSHIDCEVKPQPSSLLYTGRASAELGQPE